MRRTGMRGQCRTVSRLTARMAAPATSHEILDVNRRYHDVAADDYDAKWGIDFGEIGAAQVLGKLTKLLGPTPGPTRARSRSARAPATSRSTCCSAGVVGTATCTDISPGMLETLEANARRLGLEVETAACDAAELPFEDGSFDLVLGHAVLHHLPALERSFAEFARVLRPGGTLFFAGEPSRQGDRIAAWPKRAAMRAAPLWRRAVRRGRRRTASNGGAERRRRRARARVGRRRARVRPRRPAAADAGRRPHRHAACTARSCSRTGSAGSTARSRRARNHDDIPWPWFQFAFRGYLGLQKVDRALLEPRLPPQVFYNLMIAARKP